MNQVIFLTGATGFVGGNLAARILKQNPSSQLVVLVRAASLDEAHKRFWSPIQTIDPSILSVESLNRVLVVRGDIDDRNLGLSRLDFERVVEASTHIIHSAASVQFDLPLDRARQTNVIGTKNVMDVARIAYRAGRLQKVGYIGTAYVSGNREGLICEHELEHAAGFANSYEETKYEAELFIRSLTRELPIIVFRPSIVVGDSQTGITTSFNVLYSPLRCIYRGLLRCLPCKPSMPIDIVPIDYVRDAIYHIMCENDNEIGQTFHLTAGNSISTIGEVTDLAVEFFNESIKNEFIQKVSFPSNSSTMSESRNNAVGKLLATYESYLRLSRLFNTQNAERALKGTAIRPSPFKQYYRTILRYFIEAHWGRELKRAA